MPVTLGNFEWATANASLVFSSPVCMIAGRRAIRSGARTAHRRWMLWAFGLQALFLVGFVYRFVRFGFTELSGDGPARWAYQVVFFAHEPMAVVTVPLVVVALILGLWGKIEAHRQIVRWAYPIWVFVSATGILLYVLLYIWPS